MSPFPFGRLAVPPRGVLAFVALALLALLLVPVAWGAGALSESGLYNQGNAHARAGEIGRAVLAYERARVLDPRDPDGAANLATVRHEAGLAAPERPWWTRLATSSVSIGEWTGLGVAALAFLALLFLYRGTYPALRRYAPALREPSSRLFRILAASLGVVVIAGALGVAIWLRDLDRAVAVDGDLALRLSPFEKAEEVAHVPEGSLVVVERTFHDRWVEVEAPDGRRGWAPAERVEPIVPGR
ncbi:MAG: hypothetical protein ACC662_01385 [Planctomycetota bacterium]